MTLQIAEGVDIKTWFGKEVYITTDFNFSEITMEQFFAGAYYVLTNSDLLPEDDRLKFLEVVKKLKVGKGYNKGGKRLVNSKGSTHSFNYPG